MMNTNSEKRLVIGGDICPLGRNESLFLSGDRRALAGDLLEVLDNADGCVVNLECPLWHSDSRQTIEGIGWNRMVATSGTMVGMKALGITAVSLANNHICDAGTEGISLTRELCLQHGILSFGAGTSIQDAGRIGVLDLDGVRVGLLGISQREHNIATEWEAGANPIDPFRIAAEIQRTSGTWDHLIVLVHAGIEYYRYPSPWLQHLCRSLVELGATAVVCQHSHCAGAYEEYEGGLIVYGQGNFLFDWMPNPGLFWNEGYLVQLRLTASSLLSFDIHPTLQGGEVAGVHPMPEEEARLFRKALDEDRSRISDPAWVREAWITHCRSLAPDYLHMIRGRTAIDRLKKGIAARLHLAWDPYSSEQKQLLGNLVQCEGHREVLETIFANKDH